VDKKFGCLFLLYFREKNSQTSQSKRFQTFFINKKIKVKKKN